MKKTSFAKMMEAVKKFAGFSAEAPEVEEVELEAAEEVEESEVAEEELEEEADVEEEVELESDDEVEKSGQAEFNHNVAVLLQSIGERLESLEASFEERVSQEAERVAVARTAAQGVPTSAMPAASISISEEGPKNMSELAAGMREISDPKARAAFYEKHVERFKVGR